MPKLSMLEAAKLVPNPHGYNMRGRPPKDPKERAAYEQWKSDMNKAREGKLDLVTTEAEKQFTDEELLAHMSDKFKIMGKLVDGVTSGHIRSLMISGPGGVGKSYTIMQKLDAYKENKHGVVEVVKGIVTPVNLYMLLYQFRHKGNVVLLDDADGIFDNPEALAILKAALDTANERWISWRSESNALTKANVEDKFLYEGTCIFLTNRDIQTEVDTGTSKMKNHLQAFLTRTHYMDLGLKSRRQRLLWTSHIVRSQNVLVKDGLLKSQQEVILKWMSQNRDVLREISIRTAKFIGEYMRMAIADKKPDSWKDMAAHMMLKDFESDETEKFVPAENTASGAKVA